MREIIFRGKRVDNGEWVEGYYYKAKFYRDDTELCGYITIPHPSENGRGNEHFMVIPETVGQYTGLTDKNGKRIFEGDIIITNKFGTPKRKYVVAYDTEIATYIGEGKKGCVRYFTTFSEDADAFEVIGTIHDNPELIGGDSDA